MRRALRRLLWRGTYPRFVIDVDAILMGAVYILGSVVLVLAAVYLCERLAS